MENKEKPSVVLGRLCRGTAQAHSVYLNLQRSVRDPKHTRAPFEFRRLLPSNVSRVVLSSFNRVVIPIFSSSSPSSAKFAKFARSISILDRVERMSCELDGASTRFRSTVER